MVEEAYVSFEAAKLLKKKGFEQINCHRQYNTDGKLCNGYCYGPMAPTQQMAMRWLREEYKIFICIVTLEEIGMYGFGIEDIPSKKYLATSKSDMYPIYEEACEAAIKYCLENLI